MASPERNPIARWLPSRFVVCLAIVGSLAGGAAGQDTEAKPTSKKEKAAKARLPAYWRFLDLTDEQMKQLESVRGGATDKRMALDKKIDELQAQLADLREQLRAAEELESDSLIGILTREQRVKLAKLQADAAKRITDRRLADVKKLSESAASEAKPAAADKPTKKAAKPAE